MRYQPHPRRGTVAVICAVCLTALMGVVAVALDGGVLLDDRRHVQAAADAAALAAGDKLFLNYRTDQGLDPQNTAHAAALAVAAANGFTDGVNASVKVYIPPMSGIDAGRAGYAEVIIQYNQARYFSTLFGSQNVLVQARAVAQGRWVPFRDGIIVLNPTAPGALTNTGNGVVNVAGVPIIVDSNSPAAATATGNGTCIAPEFDITGVPGTSGSGTFSGTILNGQPPTPDPLAYIPQPDPSTMTLQSNNPTHASGQQTLSLQPGVYRGGIQVSGQASLNMAPGVYYMDGGGFSFTGLGNLNAAGVMIFNAPQRSSDVISINGNGSINFSPPTSGIYQGISLFQERSSTNTISVSGNGGSSMSGTFYTANGTLSVTGNGTNNVIGSQYISYNLTLGGGGSFSVNWDVNLTARARSLGLVE